MARPFRFQPPAVPEDTVTRPRLLAELAKRWDRRLVSVVAGPGFGKTVLLAAAVAEDAQTDTLRDVWLTCEPSDESAEHLAAGLAEAVGLPSGAGVGELCDWVWSQAPRPVCLVVDDVHEVPTGSAGAELLGRLLVELPGNGHMVLASRDRVPVPSSRLAASGQLVRLVEHDLVLDPAELSSFARAREADPDLLASSGGWPALAELMATAGADLVLDYLWEEVLAGIGDERARVLASFALVGGGDDEMVSALAGRTMGVDALVADVPLVARTDDGWATLHPLWRPALRRTLSDADLTEARQRAAEVHRRARRFGLAVELLADAEDWEAVLGVIRDAEVGPRHIGSPGEFGRWVARLPREWREHPEAVLATGLDARARSPLSALPFFAVAAQGFRAKGDVDGELAAILQDGAVRWTANDVGGVLALYERVAALATTGSPGARELAAVAQAAVAHIVGDSSGVLGALDGVGGAMTVDWLAVLHWFRSVAHRRDGDLQRSYDELDATAHLSDIDPDMEQQLRLARLRTDWLAGHVESVRTSLPAIHAHFVGTGNRFLATEAALELAARAAFLGDLDTARELLDAVEPVMAEMPGPSPRILRAIAGVVAVGADDEARAAAFVRDDVLAALGGPEAWYWRDRAAIALTYVLVPEARGAWAQEPLGPAHLPGLMLGRALVAARDGDLSLVRDMRWPPSGIVRANLPPRWIAELAAASRAAGQPAPDDLLIDLGVRLHPAIKSVVATANEAIATAASAWLREVPALPAYRLRIDVLGPLRLSRNGAEVGGADLRRQRVRQLLAYLIIHRRMRREQAAEELWPDVADPGQNLRVTLTHLQRVMQPERSQGEPPYFVKTDGAWLALVGADHLDIDSWQLDVLLDQADQAERDHDPAEALTAYQEALPLWHGEPFADVPYDDWVVPERSRLQARYVSAAVRAGELLLAVGSAIDATAAGERAIAVDPTAEPAYRLVARAHLARADPVGARGTVERCRTALAALGLEPDASTRAVLR